MSLILCIETSVNVCSVALINDGQLLDLIENFEENSHAARLSPQIQELLGHKKINISQLSAVAVSQGPGSYTGLRIGVSTAKGICYAAGIPLIAVSTLEAMAWGFVQKNNLQQSGDFLLCPMIDARRMEVYCAVFDPNLVEQQATSAQIITAASFENFRNQKTIHFFGNGAAKCSELLQGTNSVVYSNFSNSAAYMASLAHKAFAASKFVDVAYFEPFYLKDFVATTPRQKVI
jgi:tRNA threonylcarbamoyladenosine biosynthesis protein TsaB